MQLIIHAPFGSRVNRAWGLALRKRFCRQFNFELQAAATEEAILLSLGPQHSFPLDSVFRFLQPETVENILVQALLDAPMFGTHWRWNATIALAIPRSRGGRRNPPQLQRMQAEDLLAAAFPDAAACLENIPGDREVPDHPLVRQTVQDCVNLVMDLPALTAILEKIRSGEVRVVARDLPEPSPLAAEILNARPYAFLDDAPLEERRTQAVYTRRAYEPSNAADLGALDPAAIARVRDEAWPDIRNPDELHDALLTSGFLNQAEIAGGRDGVSWTPWWNELRASGRSHAVTGPGGVGLAVAMERLAESRALLAEGAEREAAVRELLRGRVGIAGPATSGEFAASLGIAEPEAEQALVALEAEGVVLRGRFTPASDGNTDVEWCERGLLARIHRYTLNRLRAEIEPVSAAHFTRFLFAWQRVDPEHRTAGLEGLAAVVEQLDGFEVPAGAWEMEVLSARCEEYQPALLDTLCLTGRVAWGRLSGGPARAAGPIRTSPIALFQREHMAEWLAGNLPFSGPPSRPTPRGCSRCSRGGEPPSSTSSSPAPAFSSPRSSRRSPSSRGADWSRRTASPGSARSSRLRTSASRWAAECGGTGPFRSGSRVRGGGGCCGERGTGKQGAEGGKQGAGGGGRGSGDAVRRQAWVLLNRYGVVFKRSARARGEHSVVARAADGVPAARGEGRDPRRALRRGNVGGAIRAAGRRNPVAGDSARGGCGVAREHQRSRPAQRHRHRRAWRADSGAGRQPDSLRGRRAGHGAGSRGGQAAR